MEQLNQSSKPVIDFLILGRYGSNYNIQTPFTFIESDDYIPLFMLHRIVGLSIYDIFNATPYITYGRRSIKHNVRFNTTRTSHYFRKGRRMLSDSINTRPVVPCKISFGFLTTFIINTIPNYLPMGIEEGSSGSFLLINDIDILTLGLIRKSKIHTSVTHDERSIEINTEDIRWLISEDKMRPIKYMKENYSGAVRTHMWTQINEISYKYGIVPEMVKDEEINKFFKFKSRFETNSLQKVVEVQEKVRNKVFSNVEKVLIA